jgi:excisionase family DNA binding protein
VIGLKNAYVNGDTMRTFIAHDGAMDATAPTKLLTVNEVAATLGCGRTLVYELLGRRELNHIKIGRLTRVPRSEVDRYVERGLSCNPGRGGPPEQRRRQPERLTALTLPFSE